MLLSATAQTTSFEAFLEDVKSFFTNAGLNIVIGIAIIIVGLLLCKLIKVILKKVLRRAKRDEAIVHFICSLTDIVLKIIVLVSALATMGINTASIITVLGTCGVAIGLALKDSLGNIASGLMIIVNKPFKKDDYVEVAGVEGTVDTINLFNTVLTTPDNKEIVIPNALISNGNVINYSANETRRVDFEFSISYDSDFFAAQNIILGVCNAHELVLDDPEPMARMRRLDDSAVVITARVWVKTPDYWSVYFDVTEQVKHKLDENGIAIPFNQLDVHLVGGDEKAQSDETVQLDIM